MLPFHLLAYEAALGVAAANTDVPAVLDPEFTQQGSHFIFTEPYTLLLAYYFAASATDARFNVPTINGIARHHFSPIQRSATIPDIPYVQDYRMQPMPLPQNEQIAVEGSNNLGAATEASTALLWVAPPGWNQNIPMGMQKLQVRFTYSITTGAGFQWTAGAITFAEALKGGSYSVIGLQVQDANTLACRLIFPRGNVVNGRRLRPGVMSMNALGNRPWPDFDGLMGVYGRFHSFEPPQIEIITTVGAAHANVEGRMLLMYEGNRGLDI